MSTTILTTHEVFELVYSMLMNRDGAVITQAVAIERARNIAASLIDITVVDALPERRHVVIPLLVSEAL